LSGSTRRRLIRRLGQRLDELADIAPVAVETISVDEERGRAVHAAADPTTKVVTHLSGVGARRQLFVGALDVYPNVGGVGQQVFILKRVLALEQNVVHLPEFPLSRSRFAHVCV